MVLTAYAVSAPKGTGATTGNVYADRRDEPQDDNRNRNRKRENSNNNAGDKGKGAKQDSLTTRLEEILQIADEDIPDSLLDTRWPVQRTLPVTYDDLQPNSSDLRQPENVSQKVEYNDSLNRYVFGTRMGGTYVAAPIMMTIDEYLNYLNRQQRREYFKAKNSEIFESKGKEKFDFADMHFDLGPAEKIFGPGGVRIKTQGTAELKFGATFKKIDNPSLPIRNRKTTTIDFDEKININVTGKVGDKVRQSHIKEGKTAENSFSTV